MNEEKKISGLSKGLLIVAAIFLAANIFLPIWKIELFAPQYPEGLVLLIYADKLAGNVDIINGLNHYIGMQTLHKENFIEFSIMRYIFLFFSVCIVMVSLIGRKKGVYILFGVFLLFAVIAMSDFYRWNYNYGHHLDPNAAIKVPGMAYQPPLIGYKQLLNFGAYSIPAIGGMFFIACGIIIVLIILWERNIFRKWFRRKSRIATTVILIGLFLFGSCGIPGPRPVKMNVEACAYCKMTISNSHFVAQLITKRGRQYVFDDLGCMVKYIKANDGAAQGSYYVADFSQPDKFIDLRSAILLQSDSLRSPMNGNLAGFISLDAAMKYASRFNTRKVSWEELIH